MFNTIIHFIHELYLNILFDYRILIKFLLCILIPPSLIAIIIVVSYFGTVVGQLILAILLLLILIGAYGSIFWTFLRHRDETTQNQGSPPWSPPDFGSFELGPIEGVLEMEGDELATSGGSVEEGAEALSG